MLYYNKQTMEKITNHFSVDINKFAKLLYDTNSFISGGSVLSAFLNEDINENQDLDIFLRIPYDREKEEKNIPSFKNHYYPYQELAKEKITNFIESQGYILDANYSSEEEINNRLKNRSNIKDELPYLQSELSKYVKNIMNYMNNGRKIQLITLYDCSIEEFLDTYDLNICRLAICSDINNKLYYYHEQNDYISKQELEHIKNKKMYIFNSKFINNISNRVKKYIDRGFKLILINDPQGNELQEKDDIEDYIKNNLIELSFYYNENVKWLRTIAYKNKQNHYGKYLKHKKLMNA